MEGVFLYNGYMTEEMHKTWEDGLKTGAASIIDAIVSMLERELYKNKGEDVVYEYAIKAVIQKVKEMKNA